MPPKSKKRSELCEQCTQDLKTNEDVVQCSGTCQARVHRYCAGVTTSHYKKISDQSSPVTFNCLHCSQEDSAAEINHLKAELESIKRIVAQVEAAVSPAQDGTTNVPRTESQDAVIQLAATPSYANILQANSNSPVGLQALL